MYEGLKTESEHLEIKPATSMMVSKIFFCIVVALCCYVKGNENSDIFDITGM